MNGAATEPGIDPDTGTAGAGAPVLHRWIAMRRGANPAMDAARAPAAIEFRLERAAATALGRAAERQARLPVFVEKVELARMTLPELPELLPERALLAVVEGRRDALGVVAVCPGLLASLIEMQAIGRITSRPTQARRPTRTDASISADFVNALLGELARECLGQAGCPDFGAFRYATYMDDPRPLSLMLEDGEMLRLTLRFRLGPGGQRDGTLMIALPVERANYAALPAGEALPAQPTPSGETAPPASSLCDAMQQVPIALVGILCRRKVSLQMLRNLAPGALIPLPQNALDDARIETPQGQVLARGRLGEADGYHAIRLRDPGLGVAPTTAWDGATFPATSTSAPPMPSEPPLQDYLQADPFRSPDSDATRSGFRGTG